MKKIFAAAVCLVGLSLITFAGCKGCSDNPEPEPPVEAELTYKYYAADEVLEIGYDNERISSSAPFYTVTGGNVESAVIPAEYDDGQNGKYKVLAIEDNAFYMGGLKTVDLSNAANLTFIGSFAFADTDLAGQITLPDSVELIGGSAFKATDITSVTLGKSLKKIEQNAFALCSELDVSLFIPDALTEIGESAFMQSGINGLTVSSSSLLETIGDYAFNDCAIMGDILIPETVKSIGKYAFTSTSLEKIFFLSKKAVTVGTQAFPAETGLTFISKNGLDACKKEKCWKAFESKTTLNALPVCSVTVGDTENGEVIAMPDTVNKFDKLTLILKPATGYEPNVIEINGQVVTPDKTDGQYLIEITVTEDIVVEATFKVV